MLNYPGRLTPALFNYPRNPSSHCSSTVPVKKPGGNQELDPGTRTRNALPRCRGERGLALLTQRWAALQHITAGP